MCGRYALAGDWSDFQKEFELEEIPGLVPRYNIAPSAGPGCEAPIVTTQGLLMARFWYIPAFWTEPLKKLPTSFNARSETLMEKGFFRGAERCLVPTSGWREFPGPAGKKKAFNFYLTSAQRTASQRADGGAPRQRSGQASTAGAPPSNHLSAPFFAFAGIKTAWQEPHSQQLVHSFAIVTGAPNALLRDYHHRMPLIVAPEHYQLWLEPQNDYQQALTDVLHYTHDAPLGVYEASTYGNSTRVEGPACIAPAAVQGSLF